MQKRLLLLLFLVVSIVAKTQVLTLKVVDKNTLEAIPFANVVLLSSDQSDVTDINGNFTLNYTSPNDTIMVLSVGYKPYQKVVKQLISAWEIKLEAENVLLDKVEIKASRKTKKRHRKEDPAYLLHQQIVAHKKENDFKSKVDYSCKIYNKVEMDVNNVTPETRKVLIFKPVAFLFDNIDSVSLPKPFVSLLFSETASDFHHQSQSDKEKEVIKGNKVSGFDIPTLSKYAGNVYMNYNVYNDYLNLFQKSFLSPLADAAWLSYNFYLSDSIVKNDTVLYQLQFFPRRTSELAFTGFVWVDNKSFAVHEIRLQMLPTANINFIQNLDLKLEYQYLDSSWVPIKESVLIDLHISPNPYGYYMKKTTTFYDYKTQVNFPDHFFNDAEKSVTWDSIEQYGNSYLENNKPDTLSAEEAVIYQKVDSAFNTRYLKTLKRIGLMFYTSYLPLKYIEIGPYYSMYSFNPIEGNRFKLGLASTTALLPKTQFLGHLAYGTLDKKYKSQARLRHYFNLNKWRYVQLEYFNDYSILSSSANAFPADNIMSSLSRRVNPRFTQVTRYGAEWFHAWYLGIENNLKINFEQLRPIGSLTYQNPDSSNIDIIHLNTIVLGGRFALDEKYVNYGFRRFSLSTRKPIFNYFFTQGFVIQNQGYKFSKLQVEMYDRYYLGYFGYLNVVLTAGKVWGKTPYPMLLNHAGNDSYYYDNKAFNLMNPFEFVSDEQVTVMLSHHFNGLFFNQIPLLKKLKWREFVFARGAIGRVSNAHQDEVLFPTGLSGLREPYVEAGVGVENILKVLRVDFLWRLTNLAPGTQVFGITFAVKPRM